MTVPRAKIMQLHDWSTAGAKENFEGATRYDQMRHDEGVVKGRAQAAECAAQKVEQMPFAGGRKRTAAEIRRDCR